MFFFFQISFVCKPRHRTIKDIKNIMQTLLKNKTIEEDIFFKMGTEAFRDQFENKMWLMYFYADGSENNIITFELRKNNANIFVLYDKHILSLDSNDFANIINKDQLTDLSQKISEFFQKNPKIEIKKDPLLQNEQKEDTQKNISIKEPEKTIIDEKSVANEKKTINISASFPYSFGDVVMSQKDLDLIYQFANYPQFEFAFSDKEIKKLITRYVLFKMLVNNAPQEQTFLNHVIDAFIKKFKITKDELYGSGISNVALLVLYGCNQFFLNQKVHLKQFGIIPLSKMLKHFINQDCINKNGILMADYIIYNQDGTEKFYKNMKQHEIPSVLLRYVYNEGPIETKIPYGDNKFVEFLKINRVFTIDQLHDVQIISIGGAEIEDVRAICGEFFSYKKIENEIKRFYKDVEIQTRKILSLSASDENIEILNILEKNNGQFVFKQENRVIVLLHLGTTEKNAKSKKKEILEDSLSYEIFLNFINSYLAYNIK